MNTFTTTNGGDDGTINLSVNADISAENSNNKLNDSDHAIRVVDDGYIPNGKGGYEGEGTVGKALFGEKIMYINQSIVGNKAAKIPEENAGTGKTSEGGATLIRTTPHELGHSANLQHAPHGTMDNNLMHQTAQPNGGLKVTNDQIRQMIKAYNSNSLNHNKQKID